MSVAFFDLDKTICAVPTEEHVTKHMWKLGKMNISSFFLVLWGFIQYNFHLISDYTHFRKKIVHSIMKQLNVNDFHSEVESLFHNQLKHKIFPQIRHRIWEHKRKNHKVVIVSTAIDSIVEFFARELDIDFHFSTKLEKDANQFTGNILGNVYHGQTKKEAVLHYCKEHNIDPKSCYAYGDYFEDRLMLEAVGNPVAINPDKKLLKFARQNDWTIFSGLSTN